MRTRKKLSRRKLLKASVAGTVALGASGKLLAGCGQDTAGEEAPNADDGGTATTPDAPGAGADDDASTPADASTPEVDGPIDPLRVVYCTDESMIAQTPTRWDYDDQNRNVDLGQVSANMDKMAAALAQRADAASAWQAILRKPAAKSWSDVKAAIKVNTVYASCIPRYAVVRKLCDVLIDQLGVEGRNICIFDSDYTAHAGHAAGVSGTYAAYAGSFPFPAGVQVSANCFTGDRSTVSLSGGALSEVECLKDLVDGTVDILINIAVNKGHYQAGNVTLTQKNNIGCVKFFCPGKTSPAGQGEYTEGSAQDLVALNQTDAIVGGDPIRQQLCIVDSLWAMRQGPAGGGITHEPATLVMGTHAGAVDYLTEKKVRAELMSSPSSRQDDINHFITGYGYSDTERQRLTELASEENRGRGWVDALG